MAKTKVVGTIEVDPLKVGSVTVWLKGRTPLICNRMAEKARRAILFPSGRPTTTDKASRLKHDPRDEFRNSMNTRPGAGATRIVFPAPAIKGAIATAALETKGTT